MFSAQDECDVFNECKTPSELVSNVQVGKYVLVTGFEFPNLVMAVPRPQP